MPYDKTNIYMSEGQKKKLATAFNKMAPIKIKFSNTQLKKQGNMPIMVTKSQMNRIDKSKKDNKGMVLSISLAQMRAMKKEGGILPFLIPIAIAGASALATGALSALGGLAVNKIASALDKKGEGLRPLGSGISPIGSGLRPIGGNVLPQGLPPAIAPIPIQQLPAGGGIMGPALQVGGCYNCGSGLYPIGQKSRGGGLFPSGVSPSKKTI